MDDVITLVMETPGQDDIGNTCPTLTEREVFCRLGSITRTEFYKAGQQGISPSYIFTIFKGDYDGEKLVKYRDKYYTVYRTYEKDADDMELYVQEKEGVTYGQADNQD